MILLREIDRPKSFGEKIAEYLARPPKPILRFYGDISTELANGRHILFAVRNGLPIPLLYGIYAEVKYNGLTDYMSKTDHIGPFSTDNWRLTLDTRQPAQVELRVGIVPFEFLTDRVQLAIEGG
ncbi:hypothetical protein ES703_53398 [subsurface metagenome]